MPVREMYGLGAGGATEGEREGGDEGGRETCKVKTKGN